MTKSSLSVICYYYPMALFLITGTSGTGKTRVCDLLKAKGIEAYDTDDDGLSRWQHNVTRYIHPKSSVKPHMRTAAFIAEHSWNVPRESLGELAEKAKDHPIFICGSIANEDEVRDLFAKIFALYIDDDELKHRLATRTSNDWGKQPHELAQSLAHHHRIYDNHRQHGDEIIDASQRPGNVMAQILKRSGVAE